jgi:diguanylate cyclase (GGDEF)-like protein/PAS domain S-box-containing protein
VDGRREQAAREAIGRLFSYLVVVDGDGIVLDVTADIHGVMGLDPDRLIGTSAFDFIDPRDHDAVARELANELDDANIAQAVTARLRDASGRYRPAELLGSNQMNNPELGALVVGVRDLTGIRVDRRVAAARDYLFSTLATTATDVTIIAEDDGQVVYVSPGVAGLLGWTEAEVMTMRHPHRHLIAPHDVDQFVTMITRVRAEPGSAERFDVRATMRSGQHRWIEVTLVNLLEDNDIRGLVAHGRDISEQREREAALRYLAEHDGLTGLVNRQAFMARLHHELPAEDRATGGVALLFCDLDRFKAINDTHGHAAGDIVLREVAVRLRTALRPSDVVARIGGDEFCVLCLGVTKDSAAEVARRVADAIGQPMNVLGNAVDVGVSVGVAWSAHGRITPEVLLFGADRLMYEAKADRTIAVEIGELLGS